MWRINVENSLSWWPNQKTGISMLVLPLKGTFKMISDNIPPRYLTEIYCSLFIDRESFLTWIISNRSDPVLNQFDPYLKVTDRDLSFASNLQEDDPGWPPRQVTLHDINPQYGWQCDISFSDCHFSLGASVMHYYLSALVFNKSFLAGIISEEYELVSTWRSFCNFRNVENAFFRYWKNSNSKKIILFNQT